MMRRGLPLLGAALLVLAIGCAERDDNDGAPTSTSEEPGTALPQETGSPLDTGNLPKPAEMVDFFENAAALKANDTAAFVALFSDKGLAEYTGDTETPTAELREIALESLAGGPAIDVTSVQNIAPYQANVGLDLNSVQGREIVKEYFELLPYEGSYLIDAYQRISPEIPEDAERIIVSATEFQYTTVAGDPNGDGNVGFTLNNDGNQPHEIILLKVAPDPTLEELVDVAVDSDPEDLPFEIEEIFGSTFAPPASVSAMAFVDALPAGRYAMMCFIPDDADGVPHAAKGMAAEFTVE